MCFTIAILVCRRCASMRDRLILLAIAAMAIDIVGFSRIYLGVHYPSDILSGFHICADWAFLLAGLFSLMKFRSSGRSGLVPNEKLQDHSDNTTDSDPPIGVYPVCSTKYCPSSDKIQSINCLTFPSGVPLVTA